MRKAITLALTFFVIVTCLPVVALAQESNGQFANNPCAIDMDQFWDGAKITKKTNDSITFENTDVLGSRSENGRTYTDNVSTTLSVVATNDIGRKEVAALSTSNANKYMEKSDSTYTIRIYTRIYYTITTSNGHKYLDLTKVTGGISGGGSGSSLGNGISITKNSCVANQKGSNINGGTSKHTTTFSAPYSQRSWEFSLPSSWVAVEDLPTNVANAVYTVKLKRTNSNWSVTLSNSATSS